jgi:hypothetical protein
VTIVFRRRSGLPEQPLERTHAPFQRRHFFERPVVCGGNTGYLAVRDSCGIAFFESGEKLRERDAQSVRDPQNAQKTEIFLAPFEMSHVSPVHSGDIGKGFLGPSAPRPQFPNTDSQPPQRIVHPSSVRECLLFGLQHDQ